MKTIYFLMVSAILVSCKGKIPKFGAKPRSNYSNYAPGTIRATQIYNRTVDSDDDNKVDLNNSSRILNGNYTIPPQVKDKPSIDLSKIKVEMPKVKALELKKPNFKYQDFNSKESQERMVKAMIELDKIKNQ